MKQPYIFAKESYALCVIYSLTSSSFRKTILYPAYHIHPHTNPARSAKEPYISAKETILSVIYSLTSSSIRRSFHQRYFFRRAYICMYIYVCICKYVYIYICTYKCKYVGLFCRYVWLFHGIYSSAVKYSDDSLISFNYF